MNRATTNFINKSVDKHGERYDYSRAHYVNSKTKVIICCREHGEFLQSPSEHLRGSGCPKCAKRNLRLNTAEFVKKAVKIHDGKYDYNLVDYIDARTAVKIICSEHGIFEQAPHIHLNGSGCPKCHETTLIDNTEKFIKRAILVHENTYDYSIAEYVDNSTPIQILCKKHGVFLQRKRNHLSGAGCPKCATESCVSRDFIKKSKLIHGNKYDYSETIYNGISHQVSIICPEHGMFQQLPSNHLARSGCRQCAIENQRSNTTSFVEKARIVHSNTYDYSLTDYIRATDKVRIICPIHGEFEQKANNHLQGQGCPICPSITSKGQEELYKFVLDLASNSMLNNRSVLSPYELDIYIPDASLGIEYHGLYWHSYDTTETPLQKNRHQTKMLAATKNGVRLLQFWEHEWLFKRDIVCSMITHRLGLSQKIDARALRISFEHDPSDFFNNNHLQGHRPAKHYISLIDKDDEIIMAASFSRYRSNIFELIRMATRNNHCVRGGVSRLMSCFKRTINAPLMTYADARYSDAGGYIAAGFSLQGITKPGYFYYHSSNKTILSRQRCQKHKLHKLLSHFNDGLTEAENMFNNGYRRVWDAGHYKLLLD